MFENGEQFGNMTALQSAVNRTTPAVAKQHNYGIDGA